MHKRMLAAITFFLLLTVSMILAIAYSMAERDGEETISQEEINVIRHLLEMELDHLSSDAALVAGSNHMSRYLTTDNETTRSYLEEDWKKEEFFSNLDIDTMIISDVNGTIRFRASLTDGVFIDTISNKTARGFMHIDGRTCMISNEPVSNHGFVLLVKVLNTEILGLINPYEEVDLVLVNLVEGPVSRDILDASGAGEICTSRDGHYLLNIRDLNGKSVAAVIFYRSNNK